MENSIIGKWSYNRTEDGWWSNDTFDTEEEAIKYGLEFAKEEELDTYFVGRFEPVGLNPQIDAVCIIENTAESLDADWGSDFDHGDRWMGKLSDEHYEELEKMMEETFNNWLEKNNLYPTSCTVIDITTHRVD